MAVAFAMILGIALLAVGALGSISGGHAHDSSVFGVNTAHHVAYVASGAIAIVAALASERAARIFCLAFGAVYGLAYELTMRLLNLDASDNYLHLAIAGTSLIVGWLSQLTEDTGQGILGTKHWRRI